jgi:hypothetical protein
VSHFDESSAADVQFNVAFSSPVTFVGATYPSGEKVMHCRSKGLHSICKKRRDNCSHTEYFWRSALLIPSVLVTRRRENTFEGS